MANENRVKIKQSVDGEFFFEHQYGNGEIGPVSETYTELRSAERAASAEYPQLPIVYDFDTE